METTNLQEVKTQIFDMINELKNLARKCELLASGHIGNATETDYKCTVCCDTKQMHLVGSGWVDAPCEACK